MDSPVPSACASPSLFRALYLAGSFLSNICPHEFLVITLVGFDCLSFFELGKLGLARAYLAKTRLNHAFWNSRLRYTMLYAWSLFFLYCTVLRYYLNYPTLFNPVILVLKNWPVTMSIRVYTMLSWILRRIVQEIELKPGVAFFFCGMWSMYVKVCGVCWPILSQISVCYYWVEQIFLHLV